MQRNVMRRMGMGSVCCGLSLMAVGYASAQQPAAERNATEQEQVQRQRAQEGEKQFCLVTELIGTTVKTQGDEEIGRIQNLIVSPQGKVQYLALGQGTPGEGESALDRLRQLREQRLENRQGRLQDREERVEDRQQGQQPEERQIDRERQPATARATAEAEGQWTLIPWEMAQFHQGETKEQQYVTVQIEKAQLEQAPSFTQQQLMSGQGQTELITQVDQFFNVRQRRGAARPELNQQSDDPNDPTRRQTPDQPERRQQQPQSDN